MSGAGRAALALCRWVGAAVDPGFCCHRAIVLEGEAHREGLGRREGEAHRGGWVVVRVRCTARVGSS